MNEQKHDASNPAITQSEAEETVQKISGVDQCNENDDLTKNGATVNQDEQALHCLQLHAALKDLPEELQLNVIAGILNNFIDKPKFLEELRIIIRENQNPRLFGAKIDFSQLELQNAYTQIEELKRINKMLSDDISILTDINVKLKICPEVNTLKGEVNTLKGEVNTLKGEVNTLKGEVNTLKGEVNTLKGEVNTLKGEVNTLKGEVNTLKGEVNTLKGEVNTLKGELNNKVREVKELQDSQKNELNYFSQEQRKLLEEISVLKKENKNVVNVNEMCEKSLDLEKMLETVNYCEETQREMSSLNISNESFRYTNTFLLAQLDTYEKKNKTALKCLLDERRNLGTFLINTATDKTLEMMKQTSICGCRNELNDTCKIRRQYLDYLVSMRLDFLEKIYECSLLFKTNEDEFKIEDIPPLPSVPSIPECNPVGIHYPSPTSINNTADMQDRLRSTMIQPQIPNNHFSSSNNVTVPQLRSVSEPPGLCPSPTRKPADKLAQTLVNFIQNDKAQKTTLRKKSKSVLKDMPSVIKDSNIEQEMIESKFKMWKVNNLPDGNFSSDHCSICMELLAKGTAFKAECGHNCFHEKCVVPWLRMNSSCPVCRKYLLLPEEFPKL